MNPWKWAETKNAQERALTEYASQGHSAYHMPDAIEMALRDPAALIELTTGRVPTNIEVMNVRPVVGRTAYVSSSIEARLHTDAAPAPPAIQYLICKNPASDGGDSFFVDTWDLAKEIKKQDGELFDALFDQVRLFTFSLGTYLGFTYSLRQGHFLCTHPPFPVEGDEVGHLFQTWVDRLSLNKFRLKAGDVSMSSNHRTLHGRTSFQDPSRHLIRILATFDTPLDKAPAAFVARAKGPEARVSRALKKESLHARYLAGVEAPFVELQKMPQQFQPALRKILQNLDIGKMIQIFHGTGHYQVNDIDLMSQTLMPIIVEFLKKLPDTNQRNKSVVRIYNALNRASGSRSSRKTKRTRAAPEKKAA